MVPKGAAAHCTTMRLAGRIANARCITQLPCGRAGQTHRYRHITRMAIEAVHMQAPTLVAAFQQTRHAALCIRAPLNLGFAQDTNHRSPRYAVVDHIDHTAYRAAAKLQSRRAAQHFNPFGGQHIERHSMVITQGRYILTGPIVIEHTDAVAIQATDDGPTRIGAKVSTGHSGQLVECFTQRTLAPFEQLQARQTGRWRGPGV